MINLKCVNFILFSIFDILCLTLGGHIVKKHIKPFPNKMIPLLNTVMSLIATCVWSILSKHTHSILFCGYMGLVYGLASIGLHQVIKQTISYFKLRKYLKNNNEKSHIVSMSD